MASSDNQGLQIALIVFVILVLLMTAGTIFTYRSNQDAWSQVASLTSQVSELNTTNRKFTAENETLRQWIGFGQAESIETLEGTYKQDMEQFAGTFPEDKRKYRDALEYLSNVLKERSETLVATTSTLEDVKAQLAASEGRKQKQVQEHQQSADSARQDLAAQTASYTQARERLEGQVQSTTQQLEQTRQEALASSQGAAKEIDRLNKDLSTQTMIKDRKIEELAGLMDPTFQVADARITWVNQATGNVMIDVGRADGLRRQTTFSVYTSEAVDLASPTPKGKIEVTNILGDHMAEARILEDSLADPLLIGDLVYTSTWTPGRQERFAIAGIFDLDGDGTPDRQLIRDLITRGGGIIDAELDGAEVSGQMSPDTRYLVLGEPPSENLQAFSDMKQTARELGVREINVAEFLDHAGFVNPARVLRPGVSAPKEFKTPAKDGDLNREGFRRRAPVRQSSGGSAY